MENTRKDFHLATMQHAWKTERQLAKLQYEKALKNFDQQQKADIAKETETYEKKVSAIRTEYDLRRDGELQILNKRLEDVARKQDAYMDEFRNYVASLPKDDQLFFKE